MIRQSKLVGQSRLYIYTLFGFADLACLEETFCTVALLRFVTILSIKQRALSGSIAGA